MVIAGGAGEWRGGWPLANVVFVVGLLVHNGAIMISLWAQRAKQA